MADARQDDLGSEARAGDELDKAVSDLLLATGQLLRRLRAQSNSAGLSWSQIATMSRLETSGPLTVADLARAEGVKPQSMGATVTALEQERLVERRPHPTDGRQVLVALSPDGREARRRTGLAKHDWLRAALLRLDAHERQLLLASADLIRRLAE